jgi:type IV secretion system protein TrbL
LIRGIVPAFAVAVLAFPVSAADRVVSPDAANSIAPLQQAVSAASPGDTIIVKAGTYNGSLDLSGVHGKPDRPIRIVSETVHGAQINGSTRRAAVGGWGVSNVVVEDFRVVSNAAGGDEGGFKLGGPWNAPASGIILSGNQVSGKGQDGIKFYNGATGNTVVGNLIDGDWRQEAMDNVSIADTVFAHNTVRGSAGFSGLTFKAGSRNVEVIGNDFGIKAPVQVSVGGYGNSRLADYGDFPDQWKGPEASSSRVHDNAINGNVRLISAIGNAVENNALNGSVSDGFNADMPDSIRSADNTVRNNGRDSVDNAGVVSRPDLPVPTENLSNLEINAGNSNNSNNSNDADFAPSPLPAQPGLLPTLPLPDPADPSSFPIPKGPTDIVIPRDHDTFVPIPAPTAPNLPTVSVSDTPVLSQAQPLGPGLLNDIVDAFKSQASKWETSLQNIAIQLFVVLAAIEVSWVVGRAMARRVDFGEILEIAVMQVITLGFFFFLLLNMAEFSLAIVASFGEAANRASIAGGGSANMSPTDIFGAGINMAQTIWSGISITSPGLSMLLVAAGFFNVLIFANITAKLIEVLIESAFVAYAGIIMMGFGGSSFTREYATGQFRYAISVGAKRFVLQLIIGLAQGLIVTWADAVAKSGTLNWQTIGFMIGAPIVMYRLAETLPQRAQDMVMGQSSYSSGSLGTTAKAVAGTAAAAAAGLAGAPVVAKAAYQLASKQMEQRAQQSGQPPSRMARAASLTGMTVKNMASGTKADIGKRLNGTGGRLGLRSWRVAHDIKKKVS